MPWKQVTDPFNNLPLSVITALLPIAFIFWALIIKKMKGYLAAVLTTVITLAIAILVYKMPAQLALLSTAHGALYGFNKSLVDSYIKSNVTGNRNYSVGNIAFVMSIGTDGPNGKTWFLDYFGSSPATSPTTLTDSGNNVLNTQQISAIDNNTNITVNLNSIMKSNIWDYGSAITVHQGNASTSTTRFGSINWAYFAMDITWTELV